MKIKSLVLKSLVGTYLGLVYFSYSTALAQETPANIAELNTTANAIVTNPPTPVDRQKYMYTSGTPVQNCDVTYKQGISECRNPTGQGFKQAGALLTTLPGIATAFMAGGDPGKMAEMCKLTQVMGMVGGLLNQGQDKTCQDVTSACSEVCGKSKEKLNTLYEQAAKAGLGPLADLYKTRIDQVNKIEDKCADDASNQALLAQQQQQANQQPMAGAEACQAALDSDTEDEIVDCTQAKFANAPECSTVSKVDPGSGIGFEPGSDLDVTEDDSDLPAPEDREDYWNSLKNKTGSGGAQGANPGAGALGGSGNSGGFGSSAQKATGGMRKSGSSLMSGGSESSGGGGSGWGNSEDDGSGKKYSGLNGKKKDLGMLTKKKIGGRDIAAAEFGSSSDDIWTRVYLRTNTRCTKQLTECTANKSLNPYGVNKAR